MFYTLGCRKRCLFAIFHRTCFGGWIALKFVYWLNEEVLHVSLIEFRIILQCITMWRIPYFSQRGIPKNNTIQLEMRKETVIARIRLFLMIPCSSGELFRWSYLWLQHWSCFRSDSTSHRVHFVWWVTARSCLSLSGRRVVWALLLRDCLPPLFSSLLWLDHPLVFGFPRIGEWERLFIFFNF